MLAILPYILLVVLLFIILFTLSGISRKLNELLERVDSVERKINAMRDGIK